MNATISLRSRLSLLQSCKLNLLNLWISKKVVHRSYRVAEQCVEQYSYCCSCDDIGHIEYYLEEALALDLTAWEVNQAVSRRAIVIWGMKFIIQIAKVFFSDVLNDLFMKYVLEVIERMFKMMPVCIAQTLTVGKAEKSV